MKVEFLIMNVRASRGAVRRAESCGYDPYLQSRSGNGGYGTACSLGSLANMGKSVELVGDKNTSLLHLPFGQWKWNWRKVRIVV
jgi:hypothetical protein